MPNWTSNILCVEGDDLSVKDFIDKVKSNTEKQEYTILTNIIPMPMSEEDDWYEWQTENWGTKWGDCDTNLASTDTNCATFRFESAWSPPLAGMHKVSEAFPNLTFILSYNEMGMGYVGSAGYRNGLVSECSSENIAVDGADDEEEFDMDKVFEAYECAQMECEDTVRDELFNLDCDPSPTHAVTKG